MGLPRSKGQPRVLLVGDGVESTGYGRVVHALTAQLREYASVVHFAINYAGPVRQIPHRIVSDGPMRDRLGTVEFRALLRSCEPDIVLFCHNWSFLPAYDAVLSEFRVRPRTVLYCAVAFPIADRDAIGALRSLDEIVSFTRYGRRCFEEAFRDAGAAPPAISVIPPPTAGMFQPVMRETGADKKFVVLNANQHTRRKRLDLTLRAFAAFSRGKTNVVLWLHHTPSREDADLLELARSLGIHDRVVMTADAQCRSSDEQLAAIYAACDVGINTSSGEGWGLIAFEHGATGAPQIVPGRGATEELWARQGITVPVAEAREPLFEPEVSIAHCVAALERLYSDPVYYTAQSRSTREFVASSAFAAPTAARRWTELLWGVEMRNHGTARKPPAGGAPP